MSRAWDDLGGRAETYADIIARAEVLRPQGQQTEQEIAERVARDKLRMKRHDETFASGFVTLADERRISIEVARQLGYFVNHAHDPVGGDD